MFFLHWFCSWLFMKLQQKNGRNVLQMKVVDCNHHLRVAINAWFLTRYNNFHGLPWRKSYYCLSYRSWPPRSSHRSWPRRSSYRSWPLCLSHRSWPLAKIWTSALLWWSFLVHRRMLPSSSLCLFATLHVGGCMIIAALLRPCFYFLLFFTTQTWPVHWETDSGDEKFITPIL